MKNEITKNALISALATALYIVLIASFMFYAPKMFGQSGKADTVFAPIAMLCLFVLSAAITGFLIFGRPVMWYLDGRKQEALSLIFYTLGVFLIITIVVLLALFLVS